MSWYLTIRSDAGYSRFADTGLLIEFLATLPELRSTGVLTFESSPGSPWVAVEAAACRPDGSYACDGSLVPRVNIGELVCSDSGEPTWYDELAGRIAAFLGWTAWEDHEERQVWPPTEQ